jgi:hypothetical protein
MLRGISCEESRTEARPNGFNTASCLETIGCGQPSMETISLTGISAPASTSMTRRRFGSDTALNTSRV